MAEELTSRQQAILGIVVREYVRTVRPVGSKTVVESYGLRVSPATVRNEMAFLEEQGYLTHLHTSAGRIPTEKGYHYFVERLMEETALSPAEQRMIRHQFYQVEMDLDEWLSLAAAILARNALAVSIVSPPKVKRGRFKQLELIPVQGTMVLIVLVLHGGVVLQRMVSVEQPIAAEELRRISGHLTEAMGGLEIVPIRASLGNLPPVEAFFVREAVEMMSELESRRTVLYRDGLSNLLAQPEYVESENVRQVISLLESDAFLANLLEEAAPQSGVHILIGGEGRWRELSECSLVLARYGIPNSSIGSLGVLGPLRMPYARAVCSVRYVSEVLNELVNQFFGVVD